MFSNEILYYKAMRDLVDLAGLIDEPAHAKAFHRQSLLVRYQLDTLFWNEDGGYYYERCEDGVCEDRVTNESALAILYDVANASQREQLFESLKTLERDWGC